MFIIPPRPYLFGVFKKEIVSPVEYVNRAIPVGASFRLQYLLINYPRTLVNESGIIQTSPELSYKLYDADGRTFQVDPVQASQVTSPAGAQGLNATSPINIDYPGGSSLKLEIIKPVVFFEGPAWVSVTFVGLRGWEHFGMGAG